MNSCFSERLFNDQMAISATETERVEMQTLDPEKLAQPPFLATDMVRGPPVFLNVKLGNSSLAILASTTYGTYRMVCNIHIVYTCMYTYNCIPISCNMYSKAASIIISM